MQKIAVNLPKRSQERYDRRLNTEQADKPHDVRSAIPMVDYTNPAKFPQYQFQEFPKMALGHGGQPVQIGDGKHDLLVFYDEEEQEEFFELNPELAEIIRSNDPAAAHKNQIERYEAEIARLKAKAGEPVDEEETKPKNALAGVAGKGKAANGLPPKMKKAS